MPQCCAYNCKNTGIHIFPKNSKRRKLWVNAVRRKNWKPSATARLCAAHFRPEDYYGKNAYTGDEPLSKFLKKDAVPSIFSFTKENPTNFLAEERQKRLQKRCQRKLFEEDLSNPEITGPSGQFQNVDTSLGAQSIEDIACEVEISTSSGSIPNTMSHQSYLLTKSTQINIEHIYGSIVRLKHDDEAIAFYTGFESYKKFYFVYSTLSPMAHKLKYYGSNVINVSTEDQFFLTMMKLRQNKCNFELARFFNISSTTVSNILITWINFIDQLWSKLNIWPEKDLIQYYMPYTFKQYDSTIRVIIDGTEIHVQKPSNPISQQASWSSYKHANTLKVMVGATPGGLLSYCSPAYAGSVSDRQTIERSDLISKCESGDSILADRGFNIQDMFISKNIRVTIPTFLKGKAQIPGLKILQDRKLASQRVHIERLIGLTKTYKILKAELHHTFVPLASKIVFVCVMCCNFRECIMKFGEK